MADQDGPPEDKMVAAAREQQQLKDERAARDQARLAAGTTIEPSDSDEPGDGDA